MARKKRASMREGPLADLFRSTDEAMADEEVKVTAVNANGNGDVALADPPAEEEIKVERTESADGKPEAESDADEPKIVEAPPVSERRIVRGGPLSEAAMNPKRDPTVEEIEERNAQKPQHQHVTEEPAVKIEHEGLQRLMGNEPPVPEAPAFGRDEPDPERTFVVPRTHQAVLRVVGVGGAGVNAVNRMVEAQVPGVEFLAINTDLQSLQSSNADSTLHIGAELTRGLGSGSDPRVGYRAAWDEQDKIKQLLAGSDMVFIAAGAGGGTGTGAAPVVAKLARDVGALTVAAVTKPFGFEGARRMAQAEEGIAALSSEVDTLIVVPNEKLLEILERRTAITDAFRVADDVLRQGVQGISDLITLPGADQPRLRRRQDHDARVRRRDPRNRHGRGGAPRDARSREGRQLTAARHVGRGRPVPAALDHRRTGPLADRGERGGPHRPRGGAPRGQHHLRREHRRGPRRAGVDHGHRQHIKKPLPPPPPPRAPGRPAQARGGDFLPGRDDRTG